VERDHPKNVLLKYIDSTHVFNEVRHTARSTTLNIEKRERNIERNY
jgi:hypothetical protein